MKKFKKVLNVLTNILFVIVIIIAATITLVSLNTKDRGVANVFGYIPLNIQTDSMKDEFGPGDLIVTKKYNGEELKEKDIITFFALEGETPILKTHRIVRVINTDGTIMYATKGDNSPGEDEPSITKNDIVSIYQNKDYKGVKVPFVGRVFDFLKSQMGFLLFIVFPLLIFFIYQLYKFIEIVIDEKKKQALLEIEKAKEKA